MNKCNKSTNFLQVSAITEALLCADQWPQWRRFGHQEKYHTQEPQPHPARAGPCGLCLHPSPSLSPWCWAGGGAGSEPVVPRAGDALCRAGALMPQEQWGEPKPAGERAPSLVSEAPGETVLCSPLPTTLTMHLPLPHSFTLDNANMLLTWVAEKWAIKRNTWENRRDSTKIKEHVFSLPGWPSYSTNWQRNSNDEAGKQGGCQQQFHKGCLTSLFVLNPGNIKYSLFHKLLNPWLCSHHHSWNKLSISQQLQKDVIRFKSRGRQRKHSNTFSYITQTSACIIFVFTFAAAILY